MSPVHFEVLGDETLRVSGEPTAVAVTDEYILVSSVRLTAWRAGTSSFLSRRSGVDRHRIAVFDRKTLSRIADIKVVGPVSSILAAPDGSFALVACGTYDGGWIYRGTILVLDLVSFSWRKVVEDNREYRDLTWLAPRVASVVASPHSDPEQHRTGWRDMSFAVPPKAELTSDFLGVLVDRGPAFPPFEMLPEQSRRARTDLARLTGEGPSVRHPITDVRIDSSGAVYACSMNTIAECWDPPGTHTWRVEGATVGGQLTLVGGQVLALASGMESQRSGDGPIIAARLFVFTAQGSLVDAPMGFDDAPCALLLTSRSGDYLVRTSARPRYQHLTPLSWLSSSDGFSVTLTLETFHGPTNNFDVRGAEDLIVVTSPPASTDVRFAYREGSKPPYFSRVSKVGQVDRLFDLNPLDEPGESADSHYGLMRIGQKELIHSLSRFKARTDEVVARAYPSGVVSWTTDLTGECSGLIEWGEDLVAADVSGRLTGIDPATGAVRWTHDVTWNDAPAIITALDACGDWLAVGTADGLVLRTRRSTMTFDPEATSP
jgi:hypothetical protein